MFLARHQAVKCSAFCNYKLIVRNIIYKCWKIHIICVTMRTHYWMKVKFFLTISTQSVYPFILSLLAQYVIL